jgi:predicted nucleic acid-binding protein
VFVSETVLDEAKRGDPVAAKKRIKFLEQFPLLSGTSEVLRLAELYLQKHIVPDKAPDDAVHLAFASAYRITFLCTWNFKHLANAFVLHRLRELNEQQGLFTPQVCTPEELLGE